MSRALALALLAALLPIGAQRSAADCPPAPAEIDLWSAPARLRGANIFQGVNEFGASNGFGDGDFSQVDFDDLRDAGANYIQISHAGLFTEDPPYVLDPAAQLNLDSKLDMIRDAGLYAVIAFRSGPGRSEHAITDRESPDLNEEIWTSQDAHDAWVDMLAYTAARYAADPNVVGYSVMVEPNANVRHNIWDPEAFYDVYGGTLEDVNGLFADATAAIRQVDANTPILLEPDGYGNVYWLPYVEDTGDARTVYTAHDYTPFPYTHDLKKKKRYPGRYDLDGDGSKERIDRAYLEEYLSTLTDVSAANDAPVALTEFGVRSTARKPARYLRDRVAIQDPMGNYAVWTWQPRGFDDPFSVHEFEKSLDVLRAAWTANCHFPAAAP